MTVTTRPGTSSGMSPAPPPGSAVHAEFMQIWEEGYVSNHISFANMQLPGLFIAEPGGLRRPDGALDRDKIRRYVDATMASHPTFRLRLQRSFLGLTPPAWVPDTAFDLDRHLVFRDGDVDLATADLRRLAGEGGPDLDLAHPLWRMVVTGLDDGRVAIGMISHHATSDGLSGMRLFGVMSQRSPDAPIPEPRDPFAGVRPARSWELPALALTRWWHGHDSPAAAWRSYREKPFWRRVRRVAARVTLPVRYGLGGAAARAAALPPMHSAYRRMDAAAAGRRARELGATLSDLQLSAMAGAWPGEERLVSMRFPVSFHSTAQPGVRNHVRDMAVFADADADFDRIVAAVHAQIEQRDDTKPYPAVPGHPIGYSTLLPWLSRPQYFCGSELVDIAPFPASLGRDRLAAAGIMYNGTLFVGVNMRREDDVEAIAGRMFELMTGEPDPGRGP